MTLTVEQMRALLARQWQQREEERVWLAREIHSTLAQDLTVLSMELSLLERKVSGPAGRRGGEDLAAVQLRLRELSGVVRRTIEWTKWVKNRLRPKVLDEFGLGAAAQWRGTEFERETGTVCVVIVEPETIDVEPQLATDCFRILEETLSNVARHAQASRVQVRLTAQNGVLALEVEDNGRGITPAAINLANSLGFAEIHERARRWGGNAEIESASSGGTMVRVKIPLPGPVPASAACGT